MSLCFRLRQAQCPECYVAKRGRWTAQGQLATLYGCRTVQATMGRLGFIILKASEQVSPQPCTMAEYMACPLRKIVSAEE